MKTKKVPIGEVIPNQSNPRIIKDEKFKKLVQSIKDFPQMLELRPIVVDIEMVVLGGNMRLKACQAAGLVEVPIIVAENLTHEQRQEFIIKDNVGFGEWDWDILANEWETAHLNEWGLELWMPKEDVNLDGFFDQEPDNEKSDPEKCKIVLEFSQEDGSLVKEKLLQIASSPEQAVWKLLKL
jgi:hypothetical protein